MGFMSKLAKYSLISGVLALIGGISLGVGGVSVIGYEVFFGDDSQLEKSKIMARMTEETVILARDGETRIGSFFQDSHRRYVGIEEVPAHMINAVIAAEDKNFYQHHGVDPMALAQAFVEGLSRGGFRRGGSTITQQAVKNILNRWEHSFQRKFKELIAALQLERRYSKREILEFYLNQFHVSGNGTGIAIAARYYFDKEVSDLNLEEAAFIAGSVKGPSKYDPFIKYNKADRDRAKEFALERKNYVLKRMLAQGWINKEEFVAAWEKQVPFNRGRFRSEEVSLVDLVRQEVAQKEILDVLDIESPSAINQAGLKIYTTIDKPVQDGAQLAMRRSLSRVEAMLSGYHPEKAEDYHPLRDLEANQFTFGKVEKIDKTPKNTAVHVTFGLATGIIEHTELLRYASYIDMPSPVGSEKRLTMLLTAVRPGDVLYVEVTEYDKEAHHAKLRMHKKPEVNGGLIVLDSGQVRAAVSGYETKGYNRAVTARRQPGSVFKSVIYLAAMQLGWSVLDRLYNEPQIYPYQGQYYFPRGDHVSPYSEVSMLWSGIRSENLAAVSLTYRLVEKLDFEQFKRLMGTMGFLPNGAESPQDFHYRIAKETGVQLENEGIRQFQLQNAVRDVAPDLVFDGQQSVLRTLRKMWWGKGYTSELRIVQANLPADTSEETKTVRIDLVLNNFVRYGRLVEVCTGAWDTVATSVRDRGPEGTLADPQMAQALDRFRVLPAGAAGGAPGLGCDTALPDEDGLPRERVRPYRDASGRRLNAIDLGSIWGDASAFHSHADLTITDVRLGGAVPLGIFQRVQQQVERRYESVLATKDRYDLYSYFQHHDFRVALGLNYLVRLCQAMGVEGKLEPVLSFGLGTNAVTVAEIAKIYQTMVTGRVHRFYEKGPSNQISIIERIEDRDGNVLYKPERNDKVIFRPEYAAAMREILRKVMTHGTGRSGLSSLKVVPNNKAPIGSPDKAEAGTLVPGFGKTGTTNDYTTAYFAGSVPYPVNKGEPLGPGNMFTIATYSGYDLNKIMRRGIVRVYGSVGALPAWSETAENLIRAQRYEDFLDTLNLDVIASRHWPFHDEDSETRVIEVDLPRGIVLKTDESGGNIDSRAGAVPDDTGAEDFVLTHTVRGLVRVPAGRGNTFNAMRTFAPFNLRGDGNFDAEEVSAKGDVGAGGTELLTPAPSPDEDSPTESADAVAPMPTPTSQSPDDPLPAPEAERERI